MGISRLNLFLIAQLFTQHHGLQVLDEAKLEEVTSLTQLDQEATREERAYQFWIQSLGIECTNLCEDVKDGILLIKVIDQIGHNLANTDWKKVNTTFKNHFQKIENCNYALDLSKKLNILSVNIGGKDIMDGNKKLILGFLWQLMRFNILNMLQNLKQGDNEFTEQDMINWANQMVANSGRTSSMGSFKDPALKTGLFLIDLCHACSPNSVNFSTVAPGQTDEECQSNAKYAISLARKIGATIFLLWEDIFEVKPRMIMTFVGSLMSLSSDRFTPSAGNSQPMQSPRTPRFKLPGLSAIAGNSSAEDNHAQSPKPLQTPRRVASSAMLLTPRRGPSGYN